MANSPCRIVHIKNSLSQIDSSLIKSASSALSMKPGEQQLLLFYCSCSSGFRPSISLITQRTGLGKRAILRNRELLVEDGLIAIHNNTVYVDWSRIQVFASVDAGMIPKQRSRRRIAPVVVRRSGRRFTDRFLLSCSAMPISSLCRILSSMTEDDFSEWKSGMSRVSKRTLAR